MHDEEDACSAARRGLRSKQCVDSGNMRNSHYAICCAATSSCLLQKHQLLCKVTLNKLNPICQVCCVGVDAFWVLSRSTQTDAYLIPRTLGSTCTMLTFCMQFFMDSLNGMANICYHFVMTSPSCVLRFCPSSALLTEWSPFQLTDYHRLCTACRVRSVGNYVLTAERSKFIVHLPICEPRLKLNDCVC